MTYNNNTVKCFKWFLFLGVLVIHSFSQLFDGFGRNKTKFLAISDGRFSGGKFLPAKKISLVIAAVKGHFFCVEPGESKEAPLWRFSFGHQRRFSPKIRRKQIYSFKSFKMTKINEFFFFFFLFEEFSWLPFFSLYRPMRWAL